MEPLPSPSPSTGRPALCAPPNPRKLNTVLAGLTKGLTAFAALCASWLVTSKSDSSTDEFDLGADTTFKSLLSCHGRRRQAQRINGPPVMASVDDVFHEGDLLPHQLLPLKPPPCLQRVGNADGGARRACASCPKRRRTVLVGFDPFEAAIERIRKEEEPCHRRARCFELIGNLLKRKLKGNKVVPLQSAARGEAGIHEEGGSRRAGAREPKGVHPQWPKLLACLGRRR